MSEQKEPDDAILVRGKLRRALRRREKRFNPNREVDPRSTVVQKRDDHAPFPNFRGFAARFREFNSFVPHEPFFWNAH